MRQREAQLKEESARLVEQAEAQDAAEDQEYGTDSDGYSVSEELARREARGRSAHAARRRPGAGGAPPAERAAQGLPADEERVIADKEQRSFAVEDSLIMLGKRGAYDNEYNCQGVVHS